MSGTFQELRLVQEECSSFPCIEIKGRKKNETDLEFHAGGCNNNGF